MKGAFGQLTVIPLGAKQHDRTDGKVLVVPPPLSPPFLDDE